MKIETFKTVENAVNFIIENQLADNLAECKAELIEKSVIKLGNIALFIDENGLLD